jgi:type IV secretion system protein VirB6
LVSGILDFVDCQAEAIGIGGYQSLAAPGSPLSTALTILLTLFIAMFGYRLILGEQLGLRDGVLALLKVGIVITLAFNWPAYRTLIYDVVLKTPSELASGIGRPAGLPDTGPGLVARLDLADRSFITLNVLGAGAGTPSPTSTLQAEPNLRQSTSTFDPLALGTARIVFLMGALTGLVGMRLVSGVLLALGPIFIALLLFDNTRGFFEGWIRVLAGAILGAIGVATILGVELALLEPRLADLVAWRSAGYAIPGAPAELMVISLVFTLATSVFVFAAWRLTNGFAFLSIFQSTLSGVGKRWHDEERREIPQGFVTVVGTTTRAAGLAASIESQQRREVMTLWDGEPRDRRAATAARTAQPHASRVDAERAAQPLPLGQRGRRIQSRDSLGARRRDSL